MRQNRTSRSGHADSESMTGRTSGWEAQTVTASGKPPRVSTQKTRKLVALTSSASGQAHQTTSHMDALRLSMLSDVRELYGPHQHVL
jgi:hypothetical protein